MKHCDICGDITPELLLTTFSPTEIRKAIENGFNPYEAIPKVKNSAATLSAKASGASDIDIFYNWKIHALSDINDWSICTNCLLALQVSSSSKPSSIKKETEKKKVCRSCGEEVPDEITVCPCGGSAFVAVETQFFNKTTDALKKEAGELYRQGENLTAVGKFKEALLIDPKDASLWTNIGGVLMEVGYFEEAVQYLKQALQIAPNLGPPGRMLNQIKATDFDITSISPISIDEVRHCVEKEQLQRVRKSICEEPEAKQRREENIRKYVEEERRKVQASRKSSGLCVMCGKPFGFFGQLVGADRHSKCTEFKY